MKNYLNMLNALNKVMPNTLTEKTVKNKAMQVIIDHLRDNDFKFEYKVGKGFVELKNS